MRRVLCILLNLMVCAWLAGCGGGSSGGGGGISAPPSLATLRSVVITPSSVTMNDVQDHPQLRATGLYSDGSTSDLSSSVIWKTADASVLSVSTSGVLSGTRKPGATTVTASFGGLSGQAAVRTIQSIFVLDNTLSQLARFDDLSESNAMFFPKRPEPLNSPTKIRLDSQGNIYAIDPPTGTLVRMEDMSGKNLQFFGPLQPPAVSITTPVGLWLDSRDFLFITDRTRNRIISDAVVGGHFAAFGSDAVFSALGGVTVDASGRIYVTDANSVVRIDNMNGDNFTRFTFPVPTDPSAVAVDSANRIYVTDTVNKAVVRIDNMTGANRVSFGTPGSGTGQFLDPSDIYLDAVGRIYVADGISGRIVRIDDMAGTNFTSLVEGSDADPVTGATVDSAGRVFFAKPATDVLGRVDSLAGGGLVTYVPRFPDPQWLALDSKGRMYVLSAGDSSITRVDDFDGNNLVVFRGTGNTALTIPVGLAFDSQDRIYVADTGNNRIVRMDDMSGTNFTTFGTLGSGIGQFDTPTGIFVDGAGRIYVNDVRGLARMDDMNGSNFTVFTGAGDTAVDQSFVSFVDKAGRIFIADTAHNRIVRMDDISGTNFVSFATEDPPFSVWLDAEGRIYYSTTLGTQTSKVFRVDDMSGSNPLQLPSPPVNPFNVVVL